MAPTDSTLDPWNLPGPGPEPRPRPNAAGMSRRELQERIRALGESAYRATQIFEGIYRARWTEWDQFTHLALALRTRLKETLDLAWPELAESRSSSDGSTKHALRLGDGALVEAVHMPYEDRATLCLSSQVGCAMGCTFCATGQMGLKRNLAAGEIVGQVMTLLLHHDHPAGRPVNLVFMGMGEPLHNLEEVMEAFGTLTDPKGLAVPPWRITLSTSGLVPGIQRLGTFPRRPRLALSLNATTDQARARIMPVTRSWGIQALGRALADFPVEKGERITVEYVLLSGINDTPADARRLTAFCRAFPAKVNLIPFNPHEGGGYAPPDEAGLDRWMGLLAAAGLPVTARRSRGQDISGACGTLAGETIPRTDPPEPSRVTALGQGKKTLE